MKTIIILILLHLTYVNTLVCWKGSSVTYSLGTEASNSNICVRYNYCSTGWNNGTCLGTSTIYYDQMSILDSNYIAKSKDIIKCTTNYCNTLVNPRTICYYGSSLNPYMREFDSTSKSCYSYMYPCTVANNYCLVSDIGKYRLAYSVSNSTTCEGIKDLVKCCQGSYCNKDYTLTSTSLACKLYSSMKIVTVLLTLYIIFMFKT